MKKEEYIAKYGEDRYQRGLLQKRQWAQDNPDRQQENNRNWFLRNPEKVREFSRKANEEHGRKGGKYYLKRLRYARTGLQCQKKKIRTKHGRMWGKYKKIIAPDSQLHHQWHLETAEYDGVALVEKEAHQHGIIDVIIILDGEITLLTERECKSIYIS
jgi:hypothetical protein